MTKNINRRAFVILLIASVVTSFMVLPYVMTLSPMIASILTPVVLTAQLIQAFIIFSVAIFVGLLFSRKVGFEMPILEGKKPIGYIKSILPISVGLGILGGLLIIMLSFLFSSLSTTFLEAEMRVETWKALLASFYGGIAEEVVFRLFLMTLLVWLSTKISKAKDGKPTNAGVWVSIIISTILFGLGHLGITGGLTAITPLVIGRAILLNGVSVFYGWLYWKKGLEAAIVAHFTTDIVIHVIMPIAARYLA